MPGSAQTALPSWPAEMAAIACGGALGACLRFSVSLAVGATELHAAFGAGIANILGSFLLGLWVGHLESGRSHPLLRPFLTIGVFGSFTTFSALALDNRALAAEDGGALAVAHLVGTLVLGLIAFALGNAVDAWLRSGRSPERPPETRE